MISHKPVIGVVGGIGSGKSRVAQILADLGAAWVNADDLAHEAFEADDVKSAIRSIWGGQVFLVDGSVDRRRLAASVFVSHSDLRRLEMVIHPWIARRREAIFASLAARPGLKAFAADSPLLFEANLDAECDFILFVDCQLDIRAARVHATRGWSREELVRRECQQLPLDFKRDRADEIVTNNSDEAALVSEVAQAFGRMLRSSRD